MEFKPVTLADKPVFEKYFSRFPQYHSEASFVTIYSWNEFTPCTFADTGSHLLYTCDGAYFAPIGSFSAEWFEYVFSLARENNAALCFADTTYLSYMKQAHPETPVLENRGYAEYYYRTEVLANLEGRAYQNIRKQINRFTARYSFTVEPVCEDNLSDIFSMLELWRAQNCAEDDAFKREEAEACKISLSHLDELNCEGIVLRIDNHVAAFAVWELLQNKVALIHYEKGLAEFDGVYKVINRETARVLLGRAEWINRESDVDAPGLREAKLRYHPNHLCKLWYANP